jgi:hypothetical protein
VARHWLSIPPENREFLRRMEAERLAAERALQATKAAAAQTKAERPLEEIQAEIKRLRRERDELRRRLSGAS